MNFRKPAIVFGGPSTRGINLDAFETRPPVQRGDLELLLGREPGVVLVLDGLFGSRLAVSPTECRDLLDAGWTLVGAASMGALRAAECWQVGMIGVGEVHALYRLGVLLSDSDVAVAYDENGQKELTLSLVHLRSVVEWMLHDRHLDQSTSQKAFAAARNIHFLERTFASCDAMWKRAGISEQCRRELRHRCELPELHPKLRDARRAVAFLRSNFWMAPSVRVGI